jgi:hypothetical protein
MQDWMWSIVEDRFLREIWRIQTTLANGTLVKVHILFATRNAEKDDFS